MHNLDKNILSSENQTGENVANFCENKLIQFKYNTKHEVDP